MINKIAVTVTFMILAIIGLLMWMAFHFYGKTVTQMDAISNLTQQKNEAEFVTQTQALSVGIFNQLAGATLNAQKANVSSSQDRQVIIQTVLKTDACALQPVPAAANSSVLQHYNAVRQGSGNANTSKPTSTMPAIASAK